MKTSQIALIFRRVARVLIIGLLGPSVFAQTFWPGMPARAQGVDDSPVRIEGYLLAQGPTKWLVGNPLDGNYLVWVTPDTVSSDKPYPVELDAWISVLARRNQAGELYAYLIQAERPAGAPGLPFEFVGKLEKMGASRWLVGIIPVEVTPNTIISGDPQIDAWLWVGAAIYPSGLRAERIQVLLLPAASGSSAKLVEVKGVIEEIAPDYWVLDGHTIKITPDTEINGTPSVGAQAECRAVQIDTGEPTATSIRVLGLFEEVELAGALATMTASSSGGQLWEITVSSPWENPQTVQVHINGNTWVDQSRAVAQPGQWIEMRGAPAGSDGYQADYVRVVRGASNTAAGGFLTPTLREAGRPTQTFTTPWGSPTTVTTGLTSASYPTLAFTPDSAAHAVWAAQGRLFYASKNPGSAWSAPAPITYGFAPYLLADTNGVLHLVYVNQFSGNYETYYINLTQGVWSLPANMSYTSGYSAQPRLAIARDHILHAVWMDYTPGYWTTYHATWNGHFWSNRPIPSGRGQAPSISAAPDGAMYVVWQNQLPRDVASLGDFEILLTELHDGYWDAPLDISDSPGINSLGPDVTATANNLAHIVWVDNEQKVRYAYGRGDHWWPPLTVADAAEAASGARIVAEMGTYLHIAWDEVSAVRTTATTENVFPWPAGYMLKNNTGTLRDVTLALIPGGGVGISWMQTDEWSGESDIYASTRAPLGRTRVWIPLLVEP